ncbi:hypothetical protein ABT144_28175 [Streptomyces sp. NPDC002039]
MPATGTGHRDPANPPGHSTGDDGTTGIVEHVFAEDAEPPQVIVTRILLY